MNEDVFPVPYRLMDKDEKKEYIAQRKQGRQSKFTARRKRRLIEDISRGMPYNVACGLAKVDYTTFRKWMQKGQAEESGEYHDFYLQMCEAEAKAKEGILQQWQSYLPTDWRALVAYWDRLHGGEVRKGQAGTSVEVNINNQPQLPQVMEDLSRLSDEELEEYQRLRQKVICQPTTIELQHNPSSTSPLMLNDAEEASDTF